MSLPWNVGEDRFLLVGVGGKVTGLGDNWVEIAGYRLPTQIVHGTVRYLSLDLPNDHDGDCDQVAEELREVQDELERSENRWLTVVQDNHERAHSEVWLFCSDRVCVEARRHLGLIGATA